MWLPLGAVSHRFNFNLIKVARLRQIGLVEGMSNAELAKKILENTPTGLITLGRPRSRWIDDVLEGIMRLRGTN